MILKVLSIILSFHFIFCTISIFWYQSKGAIMATRSRRSSRGRLTDSQCDEMLIRMVDQLDSLHIRLSNVETRISQPTNESSHVE